MENACKKKKPAKGFLTLIVNYRKIVHKRKIESAV